MNESLLSIELESFGVRHLTPKGPFSDSECPTPKFWESGRWKEGRNQNLLLSEVKISHLLSSRGR